MTENDSRPKVVYLIGAGASHACVKSAGSDQGILMQDLGSELAERVRKLVEETDEYNTLTSLVNEVIVEDADIEHVITFLDESPSSVHRQLANDLRRTFEIVLREKLDAIEEAIDDNRFSLYAALLDMYEISEFPEELYAILTLNYDEFIEEAAASVSVHPVDFGIRLQGANTPQKSLKLLKLHGSFGWRDAWPIPKIENDNEEPLWIPPGIQKGKQRYTFNVLWGLARELLDCDMLRIIGCRLGANDWDLVSLLFTTRHAHTSKTPYVVEVIDSPARANELKRSYPYLDIRSILEIETMEIGNQLVAEFSGGAPRAFDSLTPNEQKDIYETVGTNKNWFRIWLEQMAEAFEREPGVCIKTPKGEFKKLLDRG